MTTVENRGLWKILLTAVVLLLTGVVVAGVSMKSSAVANPTIHYAKASWTHDFSKDAIVADEIPHIFVAQVISMTTQYNLWVAANDDTPTTIYKMKITEVLQGSDLTPGALIAVSQYGGLTSDSKELFLIEGDSLLEETREYMIASTPNRDRGVETLLNTFGHTDLTSLPKVEGRTKITNMRKSIEATR